MDTRQHKNPIKVKVLYANTTTKEAKVLSAAMGPKLDIQDNTKTH